LNGYELAPSLHSFSGGEEESAEPGKKFEFGAKSAIFEGSFFLVVHRKGIFKEI